MPERPFAVRLVSAVVIAGLVAMLVFVVIHRLRGGSLVHVSRPVPSAVTPPAPGSDMPEPRQQALLSAMQRLQANPDDTKVLMELADNFFKQDNLEAAGNFSRRAMLAAPSDPFPPYFLGILESKQGRYTEAAALLGRSLALEDTPDTRYSLAMIAKYHQQDEVAARSHLEAALRAPDISPELRALVEAEL